MRKLLALLIALGVVATALAADALETASFSLSLPSGWVKNLNTKPVSARGPSGELLQVSSYKISGQGSPDGAQTVRGQMEKNLQRAIEAAASDAELKTIEPLTKIEAASTSMHQMVSQARDGLWFAQFGVVGPSTVVLITLEAPLKSRASVESIRKAVREIKWVQ